MIADALPMLPLADVLYSFSQSHLPGKIVIGILVIFSIFAWTIMFTKFGQVGRTKRTSRQFVEAFRSERGALDLFNQRVRVEGCSLYEIYVAGCKELTECLRGTDNEGHSNPHGGSNPLGANPLGVNPLGASPLGLRSIAPLSVNETLTLKQMDHIRGVLERTVAEQSLKLEEGLVMLATAVSGGPFLGLLGTVWGVMDAFGEIAIQGNASLTTMAPGVSGALITTVTGLLVAIPSMFGYNWLIHTVRAMTVEMDNFASELATAFEREFMRGKES